MKGILIIAHKHRWVLLELGTVYISCAKCLKLFLEKAKIPPERLTAVGFGEFQLLLPDDITQHRVGNRRVEILLASNNKN